MGPPLGRAMILEAALRRCSLPLLLFWNLGISTPTLAAVTDLPFSEVSKGYEIARRDLIRQGDTPIDQTHDTARACTANEDLCERYWELSSCAVDQPLCRFEWRRRNGRPFYVITSYDPGRKEIVLGMDED